VNLEVLTIGHSTHSIDEFMRLLSDHAVTAVADVRSAPYSRHQPDFNREVFRQSLAAGGIRYVFLGRELGARPTDRTFYDQGRVQYERLARSDSFRAGLERLLQGMASYRLAIVCAEKEPLDCHRTLLVGRELEAGGVAVSHILADGTLEPNFHAMTRLLELHNLPEEDLFRKRDELIAEACARQALRIAYVDKDRGWPPIGAVP
jgi:uncharacterized protein (DUF488 family)